MKKLSIALLMLSITSTVASAALSSFNGFYTGTHLGYNLTRVHQKSNVTTAGVPTWHRHRNFHNGNMDINLFLGFGSTIGYSNFYFGAEGALGYDRTHYKKNFLNRQVRTELKPSWHYNFSGRLGYIFCTKHLVYGRVGYSGFQKKAKVYYTNPRHTESFKRDGLLLGLGYEHAVNDHTFLRLEYQFHQGMHKTRRHRANTVRTKTSHHSNTQSYLVGIGYKF